MKRITQKNIQGRFETLQKYVKSELNLDLTYGCAYNNHYSLYVEEGSKLFPNNRCYVGKREFYEAMGIMLNIIYQFMDKKEKGLK